MLKINEKFQIRSVDPLNYGLYELTVVKGKDGAVRPEWKHVGYFGKVSHALSSALNKYIKYLTEQEALDVRELDEDTYFCYTPTSERVGEIRKRLEVKDEQRRTEREDFIISERGNA